MKVCKMGLESIWINRADGGVKVCGWTDYYLGSLLEESIEDLWNGEKAEEFRKSMIDGSYRYCFEDKCPYCANHTRDNIMVEYNVPKYPRYCSLSYEESCNYVCRFCRTKKYIPKEKDQEKIKHIEKEIHKFINGLEVLSSNGVGEVFCSPSILNVLSNIEYNDNMKIELESNGSLFNKKNWEKISNIGKNDLTVYITVHSFREDTYQFLSGTNLPVDNVIKNLYFIKNLREREIINHFEIATVICERNFREMPEYVNFCLEEFNPDAIRLRFFEPYGVRDKVTEWYYDIRNPYHPYYEEFVKIMENPIFNNPKVWKWQGDHMSVPNVHPWFIEKRKTKVLSDLITMENIKEKIENYLEEHGIDTFAIYGYGWVGKAVVRIFEQNNIECRAIFDSFFLEENNSENNYKILRPCEEKIKDVDMIIVTSEAYKEIEETIKELKYEGTVIGIKKLVEEINS